MTLFGAGWTTGSVKYVAESGVWSVTYFETTGWGGVMETEAGSPLPQRFRSLSGAVFPLYHVLADAGEFAGGKVLPTRSSDPLEVEGLALQHDGRTRVLLANLGSEPRYVRLVGLGESVRVRHLNVSNAVEAMCSPEEFRARPGTPLRAAARDGLELDLSPYTVVRVDTE
jgi:hypothetical protein